MKKFDSDMVLNCLTSLVMLSNDHHTNKNTAEAAIFDYTLLILGAKNDNYSKSIENRLVPLLEDLHRHPKTFIEALGVDYTE